MPAYTYIARNRFGKIARGELSVQSPVELRSRLVAMDLQLLTVSPKSNTWSVGSFFAGLRLSNWLPVRSREVELFLHQLAIMLRSGLRLLDSIKSLQMQCEHRALSKLLEAIYQDVNRGSSFSEALSKHKVILPIVVQLVSIGEKTGTLDKVLEQAREYLAQRRTTISEVRIALSYPALVTAAAMGIALYLVVVVIPQLKVFLAAMGRQLPAMTQSLVDLAGWLSDHGIALVSSMFGLLLFTVFVLSNATSRLWCDRQFLRLPFVGSILQLAGTAGFARCVSTMLQSGVKLVEAIRVSGYLQTNRHLEAMLRHSARAIASGQPIAPTLSGKNSFTPILPSMVEVAERSGELDKTLQEVATFCDVELKSKIKRMTRLVEPMVILLAGGIVGYVYVAFFIALMSAGGNLK